MISTPQAELIGAPPAENHAAPRSNGKFNRAALRRHALKVSDTTRHGKFTRVGEAYLDDREADTENFLRQMRAINPNSVFEPVDIGSEKFLTGEGERDLIEAFNTWIGRNIQRAVDKTRVGKTL